VALQFIADHIGRHVPSRRSGAVLRDVAEYVDLIRLDGVM
jgi:hypothetical protein